MVICKVKYPFSRLKLPAPGSLKPVTGVTETIPQVTDAGTGGKKAATVLMDSIPWVMAIIPHVRKSIPSVTRFVTDGMEAAPDLTVQVFSRWRF